MSNNSQNINASIDKDVLKALIKDLSENYNKVEININIENVNLDLKDAEDLQLILNFDKVEVKENKGNINFGNNFNTQKNYKKDSKEESNTMDEIQIKINDKKVDYIIGNKN